MPPVNRTDIGREVIRIGLPGCQYGVSATKGDNVALNISVAADLKPDAASLTEGRRVAIDGVLRIKEGAGEASVLFQPLGRGTIELDLWRSPASR